MADTLFDLLAPEPGPGDRELRIGPDEWADHLTLGSAARMVVGGPGTGKTQFLVEIVARAIDAGARPERILAIGFSRRGVEDLRGRLMDRIGPTAHRITVSTSHALAMRLVERHSSELGWDVPPAVLTGVEQEALVARLLIDERPADWPQHLRPLLETEALASELTDFLLRASDQLVGADEIAAHERADWRTLPAFLERYQASLRASRRIDYGMAVSEAVRLAGSRPDLVATFDVVVADEYQDTSPAQAALALACVGPDSGFAVAADPYQSVFSFRGADIGKVYSFPQEVSTALGRGTERIVLHTSLRVPSEVLDRAVAVTARELPGGAGKVLSRRTGGSVACHEFATIGEEAEWIAADIERIHLVDGIPLERIAVFVRSDGPFVADLTRALDRHGIDHTHTDERLLDEPAVRFVHDLVRAATRTDEAHAAMRRVLLGPFVGAPPGLVAELGDDPGAWSGWIRRALSDHGGLADLLDDASWADHDAAPEGLWHIWSTVPGLADVAIDPTRQRHRRAWSAYAQVLERARDRGVDHTLADRVDLADSVTFEEDALLDVSTGGVTVASLHRAKGTEFDIVYIGDAVEGTLPDLRHRDSILGVRHLHPHLPTDVTDYVSFRLDEERRLAYTAMTRASQRVVWTATAPSEGGSGSMPSRFMRLVADSTPPADIGEPLTPRSLVAAVRRTVVDPAAPPVDRLAGITFLASGARGHHAPLEAYGVRRRGRDTGIVPDDLRLSPSQATSYDRCPRRYAIERFLLTIDDDSPYLRIGNAVHEALERAEAGARDRGAAHADAEEALTALDEGWPGAGFPDDHVGAAWRDRARRIIRSLYDGWPSAGSVVDLEVPLTREIAGTPWSGRADRVERHGDTLRIIDYKTSATATTVADAAASLQLGFYVSAGSETPTLTAVAPVAGAAFWFPAARPTRDGIATREFSMEHRASVEERLEAITQAIRAEEFPAIPARDCDRCPVRSVCPAFPIGREAFS